MCLHLIKAFSCSNILLLLLVTTFACVNFPYCRLVLYLMQFCIRYLTVARDGGFVASEATECGYE